jgi:hypothetical protein
MRGYRGGYRGTGLPPPPPGGLIIKMNKNIFGTRRVNFAIFILFAHGGLTGGVPGTGGPAPPPPSLGFSKYNVNPSFFTLTLSEIYFWTPMETF